MDLALSLPLEPQQKDLLIIVLGLSIFFCLITVGLLIRHIQREKKRCQMPIVSLELDLEQGQEGLYLANAGDIPAKNIMIQGLDVVIEASIGGAVTLKFEPVKLLAARQREKLRFNIFSGAYPIAHITPENIAPHLVGISLQAQLNYDNLSNIPFSSTIKKDKDSRQFVVQEIKSL